MEQLRKEFNLDEKRLYITGLSMGGYGTWDAISRHPTLFEKTPATLGGPAPALGEHTDEVLTELGMGDRIGALRESRVVA